MYGIMTLNNKFTLVEVLVAITITVTVLTMISGTAWSTLQTVNVTSQRTDMAMETAALVRRLSEDLRGCLLNVTFSRAKLDLFDEDEMEPPTFYAESNGDEFMLKIYTTSAITGPAMPAGVHQVQYRLDPGEATLERLQANIGQVELEELTWRKIADDMEYIEMRFFDGEEWEEEWDSNEQLGLPLAIQVRVGRKRNGLKNRQEFVVSPEIRQRR